MRALLLRKGKKEVDRREGREGKGRGRDLPDQCQSASYAPGLNRNDSVMDLYCDQSPVGHCRVYLMYTGSTDVAIL